MKLSCDDSRPLVPVYLDGELSEEQAAPLRAHLFDCPGCREVAKQGKVLSRWFAAGLPAVSVPEGFAARVARRALAGDPGLPERTEPAAARPARPSRGSLLPFLLVASAVAASLLFVLAIALQGQTLPAENGLDALSPPTWARPEALRDEDPQAPADDEHEETTGRDPER